MTNYKRPFELRNIKDNPDGYQIQFIVHGKSHSAFETDLEKAKKVRDKMEKKLKIIRNGLFKHNPSMHKLSYIPGTDKPMPSGITIRSHKRQGTDTYEVIINWRDHTGKARLKTFYGCSETRYTLAKMKSAYQSALAFRRAYEQAVLDDILIEFDPKTFNRVAVNKDVQLANNKKKTKITTKLRTKTRLRSRKR